MKQKTLVILAILVSLAIISTAGLAAVGYDLPWWTVDSGGGRLSSAAFALNGTTGQHDSNSTFSAGGYTLSGGFWAGSSTEQITGSSIYMPLVVKEN